jgi:hypothetical protein
MSRLDQLLASYRRHVAMPLRPGLPLSQRVWFLVYSPEDERRMINRIGEFELATRDAGLDWKQLDVTNAFADWMDTYEHDEREQCLADPALVEDYASPGFRDFLAARVQGTSDAIPRDQAERTVLALTGLMELYDFVHVAAVIDALDNRFAGALLVFFPGEREGNTYRFLGARTGWDYLATPILAES